MITTKVLTRPGTDYFHSTIPRAIGEFLQLKQGDVLVWEFTGIKRDKKDGKITCIHKGSSDELDGMEVEE